MCVCVADFYQTNAANAHDHPVCEPCPLGSTTEGSTDSQDITACGKNARIIIPID